jgi:hypothetical protein
MSNHATAPEVAATGNGPRPALSPCTVPAHRPHCAVPARPGAARRGSGSAPLPASTDAVAAFRLRDPDLTPPTSKRARSGSLQLHSAQCVGRKTNLVLLGGTRNRPRPRKITAPVPGSPQTPFLPPPIRRFPPHGRPWNVQAKPVHMTLESAQGAALRAAHAYTAPRQVYAETCHASGPVGLRHGRLVCCPVSICCGTGLLVG